MDGRNDGLGRMIMGNRKASATITVRASNGKAVTFEATRSKQRCLPEGTVYWDGPDQRGREALHL